jgi:hypothetical protein
VAVAVEAEAFLVVRAATVAGVLGLLMGQTQLLELTTLAVVEAVLRTATAETAVQVL